MRVLVGEGVQADLLEHFHGALLALLAAGAGHFQAEGGVIQHAARRHQGEGLEDHAHVAPAQVDQLRLRQLGHVLAIDVDVTGAGFDQAVDQADQGGFAGAGQAHEDEDLALFDTERHIADADHGAFLGQNPLLAPAFLEQVDGFLWVRAENLVQVFDHDLSRLHGTFPLQSASSSRWHGWVRIVEA